jgi:hypothetical protein
MPQEHGSSPPQGARSSVSDAEKSSQLPPRVVYGYLRVAGNDTQRAKALKADLREFCHAFGYMLGTVFADWGAADRDLARPGFSSLLDVCQLVSSYGVLVPSVGHLSAHAETLEVLKRQIQRTGTTLIAADEVTANRHGAAVQADRLNEADAPESPAAGTPADDTTDEDGVSC